MPFDPREDFNSDAYMEVNRARDAILRPLVEAIVAEQSPASALDVGCGIGYYSEFLLGLGLRVLGVDGREENVQAAASALPGASFRLEDAERLTLQERFDLVFCAGLIYHLENPFQAVRELARVCARTCVIETRVFWSDLPQAMLVQDQDNPSQALRGYALVPSRSALVGMLRGAGFERVYAVPDAGADAHLELAAGPGSRPRRAFFVAAREQLDAASLGIEPCPDPDRFSSESIYHRSRPLFWRSVREARRWLSRPPAGPDGL